MGEQVASTNDDTTEAETLESYVDSVPKSWEMAKVEDPYRTMAKNGREAGLPDEAIVAVLDTGTAKAEAKGEKYDEERQWVREKVATALEAVADSKDDIKTTPILKDLDEYDPLTTEVEQTVLTYLGAEETFRFNNLDKILVDKSNLRQGDDKKYLNQYVQYKSNLGCSLAKAVTEKHRVYWLLLPEVVTGQMEERVKWGTKNGIPGLAEKRARIDMLELLFSDEKRIFWES